MRPHDHNVSDLIALFSACFQDSSNTVLVRGNAEPMYLPASEDRTQNQVIFAHGFFASALHEIAHWTIAGHARRKLVDYGYWYKPDGRSRQEQEAFLLVESKPQAIEWIFSDACRIPFHFSFDNLDGESGDQVRFEKMVSIQKDTYLSKGLPPRAEIFRQQLDTFYG